MPMQSTFFPDARDFVISHGSFSHVEGDQHNTHNIRISGMSTGAAAAESSRHTSITQGTTVMTIHGNQINNVMQHEKKEPTEFDDFRIVKRGDVCRHQDVAEVHNNYYCRRWYTQDCQCESCQGQVVKTVCIGKVEGTRGEFTVMSYSGRGGRKAFENDFRKYSSVVSSRVPQMYAVDIGSVPSILYWNKLMPAMVLTGNLGWMGRMYLSSLHLKWGCKQEELWIDPTRGMICCGPEGPNPNLPYSQLRIEDMPSTVDLLQEDVCLRFMASCKSKEVDQIFVVGIRSAGSDVVMPESFDQLTVISALTQTPIAVAKNVWESRRSNLVERKVLESGLIRFRVVRDGRFYLWWNGGMEDVWLCQALGVFHARGIGLDDDLSLYGLVRHEVWLQGLVSCDQIHRRQQFQQPIYLFFHPPPPDQPYGYTPSLHFWSFYEDGQNPFPPDICNNLGLPTMLKYLGGGYQSRSWSTKFYKQLDEYQRLRGFDPTTTDFAQHLGFNANIFHPINDTNRFDEVYNEPSVESRKTPPILDHPDQSGVDNNTEYPALQRGGQIENLDEPTSAHLTTKHRRIGVGEGKIERCVYSPQNHAASSELTAAGPRLRSIRPLPRRYTSSEELYSPDCGSARLADCASSSLHHYAYVNPHQNHPRPGLPANVLPTSTVFGVLPENMISTSSAACCTGLKPRAYPEISQYEMATPPCYELSHPEPESGTYASTSFSAFHNSASRTITSPVSAQPNVCAANVSMHAVQTTEWLGVLPLDQSTNNHHRISASALPNGVSISPYAPPVGYPTDPGVHAHGLYPAAPKQYSSPILNHGGGTSLPDEHWNAYRPTSSAASRDSASMIDNYNKGYQTDTDVIDTANISARSKDDRQTHLDTSISGTSDNHLTHIREVGPIVVLQATDTNILPSSSRLGVDELCIRFEQLAIV
ncbi:hypothetical protein PQX77_011556, partial [Marasmius sp. AFHP31]